VDDFLARAVLHELRFGVAEVEGEAEQFHRLTHRGGWLGFHERAEFLRDVIDRLRARAHGHAPVRAERVDGDGEGRHDAIHGRFLDEECLAAAGFFHFTVGDLGDFQFGRDGLGNARQLARLVEVIDPVAK
jgi:hypothetical protein